MKRSVLLVSLGLAVFLLAAPGVALALTQQQCLTCHTEITPGIVTQYQSGAMGDDVACLDCHGDDHSVITATGGKVSAGKCAGCHPDRYAEFTVKDATGSYINKHAQGWTRMLAGARYKVMPAAERYEMCERCHNVGYTYTDGSVGKCDSCHTRHVFSADEAREPAACGTCHMGPDHEQIDMWEKSKHGVVYMTEKERAGGDPDRAPSCVTCHQPEMVNGAGEPLTHNVSTNITYGTVAQGARLAGTPLSVPMRTMTESEFSSRRANMLAVCGDCHSSTWARQNLELADQIKMDVDELLWDPVMRIRGLWYDGLLDPMPENRPPNPVYAAAPTLVNDGYVLVLGGQQLYSDASAIEQWFFYTYKYDHVNTFKGAYHINPDYSHWFGWSEVNQDVWMIKGEEAALRRGEDAGFAMTPSRPVVGQPSTFDASALTTWGDTSPNAYAWAFGDKASTAATAATSASHTYVVPGTYTVQLTCSDSDLVNNVLQPLSCSAKRTSSLRMQVKYGSTIGLSEIARVKKGKEVTIKGSLTTDDACSVTVELWAKSGSGAWTKTGTKLYATSAGVKSTFTFKRTLSAKTTYKLTYLGDADTWDVTSRTRTVTPL
jgi:hydroxylamine dehydrogenase